MKKVLVAVDDTKGSIKNVVGMIELLLNCCGNSPEIILLYVQKIEGKSVMDELLLSESEMETLKKSLQGTEHQQDLDEKADKVIAYFAKLMQEKGMAPTKTIVKMGHPAEEILKTAEEQGVDLIAIGSRAKRFHNLFLGSVSREVANSAPVSVLLIK